MLSMKFENITFRYNDKCIFNNFNIEFNKGINFIIGNNGCGKSTLFNISKHNLPFMGKICLNNKVIDKGNKDIMFIDYNYVNSLHGVVKNIIDIDCATYLNVEKYLDCDINCLPFGLKVKIVFTKLFSTSNSVYFIDDLLIWLNKTDKEKVLKKLKTLSKNKIIIIITNNLEDTLIANRIVLLDKGNIILDDSLEKFYYNEGILSNYGFNLPFIVDLSLKLKLYNAVDKIYFNQRKLVDELWK